MHSPIQPRTNDAITVHVISAIPDRSFIVRILWFLFIGWWLGGLVIVLGYVLLPSFLTFPISFWLFNRVGTAMTLRPRSTNWVQHGSLIVPSRAKQHSPIVRLPWFIFVGWWVGAIWLFTAYVLCLLIVTWPIGMKMIDRTAGVITLERNQGRVTSSPTGVATPEAATFKAEVDTEPWLLCSTSLRDDICQVARISNQNIECDALE